MVKLVADRERATAEAGAWLARLQADPVSEQDGLDFEAWLDADAGNREAYTEALILWHEYEAAADAVLAELDAPKPRAAAPRTQTRRWWVGAGGFAIAAGLGLAILPPMLGQTALDTYSTERGQHESVTLADGSTVHLNAETKLSVRLTRGERQVVLEDGEAIFQVAHDTARPFTVAAGDHVVRVVGTQFDVRNRDGQLDVTVAEGKVQVKGASDAGQPVLLIRGQKLAIAANGAAKLTAVDPQEAFGWRAGRVVYRDTPLSVVVADLNRQFEQQVEIGDAELGQIPITGVIVLDDPGAVTQRLSLMLPVRSVPSERGLRLLKK